jgi:hypothetical protein
MFFVNRLQPAASDEPLHGIEQLQPIIQRWFRHRLPLIESFLALEKIPFTSDALGIDLQLHPFVGDTFPTDFGLGHASARLKAKG